VARAAFYHLLTSAALRLWLQTRRLPCGAANVQLTHSRRSRFGKRRHLTQRKPVCCVGGAARAFMHTTASLSRKFAN